MCNGKISWVLTLKPKTIGSIGLLDTESKNTNLPQGWSP